MAIRLGAGRVLGRLKPRFKMPRWGVRGSLFAAFALIAGMGLVIAAGAGFVFNHLGATMMDLSGRDIPRLSASLQLASQSATLAAQGPGLLASPSDEALKERTKSVKDIQQLAMAKLGEIIELGADKQIATALRDTASTRRPRAWCRPRVSGSRPARCMTSSMRRCARRSSPSSARPVLRCWTHRHA
jgi:hypothetical protein